MHVHERELVLSATDLSNFLGCRHRTGLDMAVAYGRRKRPYRDDPLLELLWKRGIEHERKFVETLRATSLTVVDLGGLDDPAERVTVTLEEMKRGTDVIVQGGLSDDRWFGKPDVMRRVRRPSALGDWSYEISDTKLARETRAGTILQLGLYSEMLAVAQGARPESFHVVTPDPTTPVHTYRVDDYAAYFRFVRGKMIETVALGYGRVAEDNYPEPVEHCETCQWHSDCSAKRRADDHLSLVAGITRTQRRELEARSVDTLMSLAGLTIPLTFKPRRGSAGTYPGIRDQARLQLESRGKSPPLHELLPIEPEKGLCRLPEPTPGDLFLDLEGDGFAGEGGSGREYLFGVARTDGRYEAAWAFTDLEERRGFEWVIDAIARAAREHPGMHVYHYASYEPASFKRLMGRYATRERELDAMLRAGRFVDLYAVVRQALRAGVERYSIKNVEPLYGFERSVALFDANRNLKLMEYGLETGMPDSVPVEVRSVVESYNRDDCVSTLRLREWLERVRAELVASGTEVSRRSLADGTAPVAVDERSQKVDELRARLLAGIPEARLERNDEQQGRWLLAYMLDYHRREDKATWWEYFRLCELAEEDLYDERAAIAGMTFVERVRRVISKRTGKPTKSVVDRYRYPVQEMEIDPGDEVWLLDKKKFGKAVAVDRIQFTIDVEIGPSRAQIRPSAMFAFSHVSSDAMESALLRIGESVSAGHDAYGAARALLTGMPPRLASGPFDKPPSENVLDFAVRAGCNLVDTVLAIQGPPGSGKTFCGARMICELVRQGKRVGVTAASHKAICNLLDAVANEANKDAVPVRLAHKNGEEDESSDSPHVKTLADNPDALAAIESGEANVVGGTAWLWARPEFANAVDVLFVDEAGQMALANVLAVSQAANSVVLLGDPRQLEQPRKGTHPDGVGVSALEHILAGKQTIPSERGIFLPETWRLAPSICRFTSEVFYDGRLTSHAGLERQRIVGVDRIPEAGLAFIAVDDDGNKNWSPEEIDVVCDLVARFTTRGATWIDANGSERPIVGSDVLVVAPYNAHVTRLLERLAGSGARVGTVDKFQGQAAPVVIYSMATSRPEDAPRGMEFLYSLNRLNVATSRAQCVAVLVASPLLFEPECKNPRQMQLANGLCRFRELATLSSV
jgi:uncharacterized protein